MRLVLRFNLAEDGTGAASLEVAVHVFEDEPVRARVAHIANPLDEATLGLQNLEGMHATDWDGHWSEVGLWVVQWRV